MLYYFLILFKDNRIAIECLDFAVEGLHRNTEGATNESQPLPVDEIVNIYLPRPVETVEDSSSDEDHEMKLTRQLKS